MDLDTFKDLKSKAFREMTREGNTASPDLLMKAFLKFTASPRDRGYSTLAHIMNRMEGDLWSPDMPYPFHRVADGLLQKLRKLGLVRVDKRKWMLTGAGEEFVEMAKAEISEQDRTPAPS